MTGVISIKVDINKTSDGLGKLHPAVVRNVDSKLWRGAEEVAITGRLNAPKAFTNLANSIRAERVEEMHYIVSQNVDRYGRAVEEGGRPHRFDSTKLIPWVERVLGVHGKDARSKAFLIARSIAMHGTRAQPHMRPAAESNSQRVQQLVAVGVEQGKKEAFHV